MHRIIEADKLHGPHVDSWYARRFVSPTCFSEVELAGEVILRGSSVWCRRWRRRFWPDFHLQLSKYGCHRVGSWCVVRAIHSRTLVRRLIPVTRLQQGDENHMVRRRFFTQERQETV